MSTPKLPDPLRAMSEEGRREASRLDEIRAWTNGFDDLDFENPETIFALGADDVAYLLRELDARTAERDAAYAAGLERAAALCEERSRAIACRDDRYQGETPSMTALLCAGEIRAERERAARACEEQGRGHSPDDDTAPGPQHLLRVVLFLAADAIRRGGEK